MQDYAVRAITQDGSFRVIAIRTTDTVRKIAEIQQAGEYTEALADLVTGAVLVRQTMAPDYRVQIAIRQGSTPGGTTLMGDSHPGGMTRGLCTPVDERPLDLSSGEAMLQVTRVLYTNELNQGIVALGEDVTMSNALTEYMHTSEQITSIIEIASVVENGKIVNCAGFIIQMLPEVHDEPIARFLYHFERREALRDILLERDANPEQMLASLLSDFEHTVFEPEPISFGCNCSEARVVGALATMGREELTSIIDSGEVLEIDCDYCKTEYKIGAEQLRPLLDTN